MHILVLGAAAGGGFPQWNCRCAQCEGMRQGRLNARPRTQSSIALSVDGERWLLVNASPDIRQQLAASPVLWPAKGLRDSRLQGILLTDAQIDHVTGLFTLREGCPLPLFCTPSVEEELRTSFPLLKVMQHWKGGFEVHALPESADAPVAIPFLPGLDLRIVPLLSNAPPYSPRRHRPQPGDNIGLFIHDSTTGRRFFYAPGLGDISPEVTACMAQADLMLVDGTFWTNDEMASVGLTGACARDMGHLPLSGPGGMLEVLAQYPSARRILIHINNTNPVLVEDSPQRAELERSGIEVAFDGLEIVL